MLLDVAGDEIVQSDHLVALRRIKAIAEMRSDESGRSRNNISHASTMLLERTGLPHCEYRFLVHHARPRKYRLSE